MARSHIVEPSGARREHTDLLVGHRGQRRQFERMPVASSPVERTLDSSTKHGEAAPLTNGGGDGQWGPRRVAGSTLTTAEGKAEGREERVAPRVPLRPLTGWGRNPVVEGYELWSENLEAITAGVVLSRGLGRSYGDSSLPPCDHHQVAASPLADRLLAFDPATGIVRAEAGLSLRRLNRVFMPRGWFTPVTPGTEYVTLGGMVAADVHGKNHHVEGCFGEHVTGLRMRVADGRVLEVTEANEPELFRATLGGLGLTGHILEVEFRLKPIASPWIWCETRRVPDIEAAIAALEEAGTSWPYTVCWADCHAKGSHLGRGIIFQGRWAEAPEAPRKLPAEKRLLSVPFVFPEWALNNWTVSTFNALNYWKQRPGGREGIVHPQEFFYPLDAVLNWNRAYGKRGFTQYQCLLPATRGHSAHRRLIELLTEHGGTPFLCVIKDCGREGKGMLSFPKPGISIAVDLPIRGPETQALVDALNELVIAEAGRIYLAKDTFTRPEHYRAMDPRLDAWNAVRRKWDPERRLRSAQSVRLFGE